MHMYIHVIESLSDMYIHVCMHTLTQAMRMSTMISSPSMVAIMRDVWPLLYSLGRQTERKSKREREREKRRGRDKRSGREWSGREWSGREWSGRGEWE